MKMLYVAGPYRDARGTWYIKQNIERAERVAIALWEMGFAVVCPHKNTAFFEGPLTDSVIIAGDLEMVRRSDGVVVLPGWENSVGTKMERAEALSLSKPVFYWADYLTTTYLLNWRHNNRDLHDAFMKSQRQAYEREEAQRLTRLGLDPKAKVQHAKATKTEKAGRTVGTLPKRLATPARRTDRSGRQEHDRPPGGERHRRKQGAD